MGCAPPATSETTRGADVALAALLFAAALVWFSLTLPHTFHPADDGYLLAQSARVAAGEIPHRDFVDVYGPGTFGLTALAMLALGDGALEVHYFVAGAKALAVALGYLLLRTVTPRGFALLGALVAIGFWGRVLWNLNAPYATVYTLAIAPAAPLALIGARRRGSAAGLVLAGALAGIAMLFKQSLGGYLTIGLGLALGAEGMLRAPRGSRVRLDTALALAGWALAAAVPILPLLRFTTGFEYALHILPLHAAMLVVAVAVLRRGGSGSLWLVLRDRLLPFGAGVAAVLGATALLYASWGALDTLWDDLFVLPLTLANYHRPVHLPPAPLALGAAAAAAAAAAPLLGLAGRRRVAVATGIAALALLSLAAGLAGGAESRAGAAPLRDWIRHGPVLLAGVLPAILAWTALATLGPPLLRGELPEGPGNAWLTLLFFHLFLVFQGFPRAGPDLFQPQALQMGFAVALVALWHRRICAETGSPATRGAAALLSMAIPLWLVAEPVAGAVETVRERSGYRELRMPRLGGISLPRPEFRSQHLGEIERLVGRLAAAPGDEPVLLLTHEDVILYASGRRPLMARERAHLFWLAWNMPSTRADAAFEARILRELDAAPGARVVESRDRSTRGLLDAFPRLRRHLDANYRVEAREGRYRVLARTPAQ